MKRPRGLPPRAPVIYLALIGGWSRDVPWALWVERERTNTQPKESLPLAQGRLPLEAQAAERRSPADLLELVARQITRGDANLYGESLCRSPGPKVGDPVPPRGGNGGGSGGTNSEG